MKRLLLHVGYPKSASTSLQNGLFIELHREGVINFLGRAFEKNFYGALKNKTNYKNWFDHVVEGGSPDTGLTIGALSESLPNILSEGLFMMNERHGADVIGPVILQKYFAPQTDKLDVLIVIRKQPDMIPSYYIQNYRRFDQKVFGDFVAFQEQNNWSGEAKIFNFHGVVKAYVAVFGRDNVHVVLFEDFVGNRDRFSTQLGGAMNVDPAAIRAHLGDAQLNATRKEADTVVIRKLKRSSLRGRLIRLLEGFGLGFVDSLRTRIPAVTDEEKKIIFDRFKDSNRRLAEEFSLDQAAMREYGYF